MMNNFNEYLIKYVFNYCCFDDRKNISLVCKKWNKYHHYINFNESAKKLLNNITEQEWVTIYNYYKIHNRLDGIYKKEYTILLKAIEFGFYDITKLFIHKYEKNPSYRRYNAIRIACIKYHYNIVKLLLKKNHSDEVLSKALSSLIITPQYAYYRITKLLLHYAKLRPIYIDILYEYEGIYNLTNAVYYGYNDLVKMILKLDINNYYDINKLMCAAISCGNYKIVKYILNNDSFTGMSYNCKCVKRCIKDKRHYNNHGKILNLLIKSNKIHL